MVWIAVIYCITHNYIEHFTWVDIDTINKKETQQCWDKTGNALQIQEEVNPVYWYNLVGDTEMKILKKFVQVAGRGHIAADNNLEVNNIAISLWG